MADELTEFPAVRRLFEDLRFVVVGAYVLDCLINTPRLPEWGRAYEARSIRTSPGGKALNQAVALARLGAQVAAVGVVGGDEAGRRILAALEREGIDIRSMESQPGMATTMCTCFVGDAGESAIVWRIDEDVTVGLETVRTADPLIKKADGVLVTFEMPVAAIAETIHTAHSCGARVFVQPAPALVDPADRNSVPWEHIDVLAPNQEEARALLGSDDDVSADDLADALAREFQVPMVVVTLGESGCVTHTSGVTHRYAAEPAEVVDTTGAGDAFMAALTASLLAGLPDDQAIHFAQVNAARAVQRAGSYESMPSPG